MTSLISNQPHHSSTIQGPLECFEGALRGHVRAPAPEWRPIRMHMWQLFRMNKTLSSSSSWCISQGREGEGREEREGERWDGEEDSGEGGGGFREGESGLGCRVKSNGIHLAAAVRVFSKS